MQQENLVLIRIAVYSAATISGFIFLMFYLFIKLKKKHIYIENNIIELKHNLEKNTLTAKLEIQEETLNRISKDIHDNISLSLTLAKLHLNNIIRTENNKEHNTTISTCIDLISKSIIDLSDLSKSLDGEIVKKFGLIEAVERELVYVRKLGQPDAGLRIDGETRFLNWEIELMIFRIIQESIRNAISHSKCKSLLITLNFNESFLEVTIKDDGIGFNLEIQKNNKIISSGLKNMINRSKLINGKLNVTSKVNEGTIISIETPYS